MIGTIRYHNKPIVQFLCHHNECKMNSEFKVSKLRHQMIFVVLLLKTQQDKTMKNMP